MGEQVVDQGKQSKGKRSSNPIPPLGGKAEAPLPNSARTALHAAAGAPPPHPPRYVLPRSRLAPSALSQQPTTGPEMNSGGVASGGGGSARGQLCRRACGAAASLALLVASILLCLAPLYYHGALGMVLGLLGLLLVVLGLVGLFLSFLGLGGSGSPAVVIPATAVKQPLLGCRNVSSGRPGSTMTVVVE